MPRKRMNGTRLHLIVTSPQYAALTKESEMTGLPMSEILRRAIDDYLKERKRNASK